MEIKIKSNRNWIVMVFLPALVLGLIPVIFISVLFIINYEAMKENLGVLILLTALCIIIAIIMLCIKFYNGKSYVFNEEQIDMYSRGKYRETIKISNVTNINYYPLKFQYIITIFAGALMEGGATKLIIYDKKGNKTQWGLFSRKDVAKLNELYNGLIVVK